jgi:hypothetical protein
MKRLILCATLAVACVCAGLAARTVRRQVGVAVPLTIHWQATEYDDHGNAIQTFTEQRDISADGRWLDRKTFNDGTHQAQYAEPSSGVFALARNARVRVGDAEPAQVMTEARLRDSPQFNRDDVVLGIPCIVLRFEKHLPEGTMTDDTWYAPTLGGAFVKKVITEPGMVFVLEPVSITLGEPNPRVFDVPETPVVTPRK